MFQALIEMIYSIRMLFLTIPLHTELREVCSIIDSSDEAWLLTILTATEKNNRIGNLEEATQQEKKVYIIRRAFCKGVYGVQL